MDTTQLPEILDVGTGIYVLYIIGFILSSTVLSVLVNSYLNRKKDVAETKRNDAETENLIVKSYESIVEDLRNELKRQKEIVDELKARMDRYSAREIELMKKVTILEGENATLRSQVNELMKNDKN